MEVVHVFREWVVIEGPQGTGKEPYAEKLASRLGFFSLSEFHDLPTWSDDLADHGNAVVIPELPDVACCWRHVADLFVRPGARVRFPSGRKGGYRTLRMPRVIITALSTQQMPDDFRRKSVIIDASDLPDEVVFHRILERVD